jgi:hypothetical protein
MALTPEDNRLLLALRAALERKHEHPFSIADVVREALQTKAKTLSLEV